VTVSVATNSAAIQDAGLQARRLFFCGLQGKVRRRSIRSSRRRSFDIYADRLTAARFISTISASYSASSSASLGSLPLIDVRCVASIGRSPSRRLPRPRRETHKAPNEQRQARLRPTNPHTLPWRLPLPRRPIGELSRLASASYPSSGSKPEKSYPSRAKDASAVRKGVTPALSETA
jgi:hypothetical protein